MKNLYKIILLIAFCIVYGKVSSQAYHEKDANGEKLYYKLMSANPEYINRCIEDNIRNARYSNYFFLINDSVYNNLYQQWQLIPTTISGYYIKNRGSGRYIKMDDNYWVGSYMCPSYIGTKYGASIFDIISIGSDQVVLRYTDSDGDFHYLNAVDSISCETNIINLSDIKNTTNAWIVRNSDGSPLGIKSLTFESNIDISVVNHKIVVVGCDRYSIYDIQGRKIKNIDNLIPGIYIVDAQNELYKILIP